MIGTNILLKRHSIGQGPVLVAGSRMYEGREDRRQLYRAAFGVDIQEGPGVDLVHNLEKPLPAGYTGYGHVDCCSVLEHVARPWLAAQTLQDALSTGGTILVSVPFVWRVHAYPSDFWRFTPEALSILFTDIEWTETWLVSGGEIVDKAPTFNDESGGRWFARTEVMAFGVKCASNS